MRPAGRPQGSPLRTQGRANPLALLAAPRGGKFDAGSESPTAYPHSLLHAREGGHPVPTAPSSTHALPRSKRRGQWIVRVRGR
jgi:hypothetical protein